MPRISASCCWISWKRASSLPNCRRSQRIGTRDVERGQLDAGALPAHPGARIAQQLVGLGEVGGARQQVGRRDADLVEDDVRVLHDAQADLVGDLRGGVAGTVGLHDEALDLLVGDIPGPHEREVRDGARTDPALGAVDTHSPPSSRAVVARPPAMSEPWSGSVRANAPSWVNAVRPGSQRAFCSSEPSSSIMPTISSLWIPTSAERDTSARATSTYMSPLKSLDVAVGLQPAESVLPEFSEQPEGELLAVPVVDRRGPDPGLQEFPDLLVPELFRPAAAGPRCT